MKVKELIEKLKKYDEGLEVEIIMSSASSCINDVYKQGKTIYITDESF